MTVLTSALTRTFRHKHLLGIEELSLADVSVLLARARELAPLTRAAEAKTSALRGKTVLNLFFEASTRTRTSFELAAKRLGADAVNISASGSSVSKGETLLDTVRNVDAMRADVIVIRHEASGAPHLLARALDEAGSRCAIVNAGDGLSEHPTQALLDAYVILQALSCADLAGKIVVIAGDILHSRVARSNLRLLTLLGAQVRLVGPRTLLPPHVIDLARKPGSASVGYRFEEALEGADVIMMLRVQRERIAAACFPSTREYAKTFGLGSARLALAKPSAVVMHPGPINRGVELDDAVASSDRALILQQVEAGLAVRMAVLDLLAS